MNNSLSLSYIVLAVLIAVLLALTFSCFHISGISRNDLP